MRVYTKNDIDATRNSFKNLRYRESFAELNKQKFSFFIIPRDRNPSLVNFALVLAGATKEDGYVIGVSSQVDVAYRPLWAYHELVEVVEPGPANKLRCVDALKKELDVASIVLQKEHFPKYIHTRKKFFEDLVKYSMDRIDQYGKETVKEFQESLDHLVSETAL